MSDRAIVKIHFLDNSYKGLHVTASTTIREVLSMIAQKIDLKDTEHFAIYDVGKDSERVLTDERPMDVMRGWYERDPSGKSSKFVFKSRLFFRGKPVSSDPQCQHLLFIQGVHDVISGSYPCTEQEAIKLAGIQLFVSYGEHNPDLHHVGFLTTKVHLFVPRPLLARRKPEEWEDMILREHASLKNSVRDQPAAKLMYLEIVRKWHFYGHQFFKVEQLDSESVVVVPAAYLGVYSEGVMLLKHPNKEFVDNFQYTDICTWCSTPATFSISLGGPTEKPDEPSVTHRFGTSQGRQISDIMQAYIDVLVSELNAEEVDQYDDDEPMDDGDDA